MAERFVVCYGWWQAVDVLLSGVSPGRVGLVSVVGRAKIEK